LHYGTLLGSRACVHMAAAAWGSGFLNALLHTANTFSLPLCQGNALDQFFCEIPQILKLSCTDYYFREAGLLVVSVCLGFGCFIFIVLSYVQTFRAVLRIPSEQGRHKAFSTCLPHLSVISLFLSSVMFAYLKPPSISSPALDLVVAVLYSVVPPVSHQEAASIMAVPSETQARTARRFPGILQKDYTLFLILTTVDCLGLESSQGPFQDERLCISFRHGSSLHDEGESAHVAHDHRSKQT
ncbi:olfactory receptor 14C36-like, partial [Chroicocephalus ridibundus]|uniref:olfactory receptor 14C36-like n=1 Tax=Chroicocephalus ridibundus TaxID=1192867 RepID=UPI002FDD88FB